MTDESRTRWGYNQQEPRRMRKIVTHLPVVVSATTSRRESSSSLTSTSRSSPSARTASHTSSSSVVCWRSKHVLSLGNWLAAIYERETLFILFVHITKDVGFSCSVCRTCTSRVLSVSCSAIGVLRRVMPVGDSVNLVGFLERCVGHTTVSLVLIVVDLLLELSRDSAGTRSP